MCSSYILNKTLVNTNFSKVFMNESLIYELLFKRQNATIFVHDFLVLYLNMFTH